jgi:hypothetical protein
VEFIPCETAQFMARDAKDTPSAWLLTVGPTQLDPCCDAILPFKNKLAATLSTSSSPLIAMVARRLWRGPAQWPEQAIDEAIMAWCMEQIYVSHELRTLALTLEGNLAAVERL